MLRLTPRSFVGISLGELEQISEEKFRWSIESLWEDIGAVFSLGGTFCISSKQYNNFSPDLNVREVFEEMGIAAPTHVHMQTLALRDSSYFTFSEMLLYLKRLKAFSSMHDKINLVISGTDQLANIANIAEIFQTKSVFIGAMDPSGRDRLANLLLGLHAAKTLYALKYPGAFLAQGGCVAEPQFLTKEDPHALFGAFGTRLADPIIAMQPSGSICVYREPSLLRWDNLYIPELSEIFDNTMAYAHRCLGKILTITARLDLYQAERLLAMVEDSLNTTDGILGVIFRGFGTGGVQTRMPLFHPDGITRNHTNGTVLWKMFRKIARKIPVVMTTQCARGGVTEDYEYASMLKEAGIILSGFFTEDFLDIYMTILSIASLTQTNEEQERGLWMRRQLEQFFRINS